VGEALTRGVIEGMFWEETKAMAKYRVKAYFMHEREESAARQAVQAQTIAEAEWTPGYVVGVVDEKEIKALSEKGLVVTPIERVVRSKATTPSAPKLSESAAMEAAMVMPGVFSLNAPIAGAARRARRLPTVEADDDPGEKILSRNTKSADFYVVRFHGPLTEERRTELNKRGVKLLEKVTRHKYTVRLEPSRGDCMWICSRCSTTVATGMQRVVSSMR
jgi:hypothetical protein